MFFWDYAIVLIATSWSFSVWFQGKLSFVFNFIVFHPAILVNLLFFCLQNWWFNKYQDHVGCGRHSKFSLVFERFYGGIYTSLSSLLELFCCRVYLNMSLMILFMPGGVIRFYKLWKQLELGYCMIMDLSIFQVLLFYPL